MLHIVNHEVQSRWSGMERLFSYLTSVIYSLNNTLDTNTFQPAIIVAGFDYTFGPDKKTGWHLKDALMEKSLLFLQRGEGQD